MAANDNGDKRQNMRNELMIKGDNQLRKAGYVKGEERENTDYPLSNIKGTEELHTKFKKKKKISTNFEMSKLQEKY